MFARFLRRRLVATNVARLEQSLAQTLKLLVASVERLEIGPWRRRCRNLGQHDLSVAQGRSLIDDRTEDFRVDASAAGKSRILQNSKLELDLDACLFVNAIGQIARRRQFEGGGRETPMSSRLLISLIASWALAENPMLVVHTAAHCARRKRLRAPQGPSHRRPCARQHRRACLLPNARDDWVGDKDRLGSAALRCRSCRFGRGRIGR